MKTSLVVFLVGVTPVLGQGVSSAQQPSLEAEAALIRAFEHFWEARAAVLRAIDSVRDPKTRESIREHFKKNEEAWDRLIDQETFLIYGWTRGAAEPSTKYRRVVAAQRAPERIAQFERIATAILVQERANKAPEPTP